MLNSFFNIDALTTEYLRTVMRKIVFILALFISAAIISCSDSSGDDSEKGYVDPGLDSEKIVAVKSYTLGSASCSGKQCGAVIYQGKLSDTRYVGFAAGSDTTNPNFTLKIYWNGSSIPGAIDTTDFSVNVSDGTYVYNTTTDNLNVTITAGADINSVTIYTISFVEPITASDGSGHNYTINALNSIVAYKYP